MKNNNLIKIPGFLSYCKNIKASFDGGIASCVKNEVIANTLKISEGDDENEYIITRHDQFFTPINIIIMYGDQEC